MTQTTIPIDIIARESEAVQHVADAQRLTCGYCGASWYAETWRALPQTPVAPQATPPQYDPYC